MGMTKERARYLFQEACLFLALSYLVLLGGTFNGLVLYSLNVINLIFVSGLGFFWILIRTIRKSNFPCTRLDIGIILFFSAAIVSTIYSVDPRRSLISLVILAVAILVYYLFVNLIRQGVSIQLINKVLFLVSAFILFFGVRELILLYSGWIRVSDHADLIPPTTFRIKAFLGNPNFVAAYLNLLIPLGLARILGKKQFGSKLIIGLWLLIALFLVYFTASRGGWLGTISAIGTFFIFWGMENWQQLKNILKDLIMKWWVIIGIAVILILGILTFLALLKWQLSDPSRSASIFSSRGFVWVVAWDMIRAKTITGNGLFTFGTEYLKVGSIPPLMVLAHAHNYYLNVAAEMGVVGISSLLICLGLLIFTAWSAWKSHDYLNRTELAGIFGVFAGLGVHSLFDTPQTMPLFMIVPAIYLAQLSSGVKMAEGRTQDWVGNYSLAGLWLIASIGMSMDVRALTPFNRGVEASNQENWSMAVDYFDKAVKLDPGNAFYWFQYGFACGKNALNLDGEIIDEISLNKAIFAYQKGLEIESEYSINLMNLGLLLWAKGERDQAIEYVKTAAEKSSTKEAFYLTLGSMLENTKRIEGAKAAYIQALAQNSSWGEEPFFRKTSLRESVVSEWHSGILVPEIEKNTYPPRKDKNAYLVEGWDLLDAGEHDLALIALLQAPSFNNPETYFALGRTYLLLEDIPAAEKNFQIAHWMSSGRNWQINLNLGDIAVLNADCRGAIEYYSRAIELLERTTSYGIGTLGTSQYGWYLFNKPSIALDLLPGMENIIFSNEVIVGMHNLSLCYLELGQLESAKTIYHKILFHRPDDIVATQKLAEFRDK